MALLGLKSRQIGQVGGGRQRQSGIVDLATVQSLVRRDDLPEFSPTTASSSSTNVTAFHCHGRGLPRQAPARYFWA